eukprot:2060974-Prymnesium_polylepis.1
MRAAESGGRHRPFAHMRAADDSFFSRGRGTPHLVWSPSGASLWHVRLLAGLDPNAPEGLPQHRRDLRGHVRRHDLRCAHPLDASALDAPASLSDEAVTACNRLGEPALMRP